MKKKAMSSLKVQKCFTGASVDLLTRVTKLLCKTYSKQFKGHSANFHIYKLWPGVWKTTEAYQK